jgi:D-alanyl-D-alanine carboxypeptidase/D-alanyl-D-alanine-endopeptidase (penicillin-binding protein 4)
VRVSTGWHRRLRAVAGALLVAVTAATLTAPVRAAPVASEGARIPPPPRPAPAPSEPSVPPPGALVDRFERLQEFPQTRPDGTVGLAVIDATGQRLAARNPETPLLPASTMKLVTAAAALRLLGPGHRFVTRVYATAPVAADGVVDGDLVVVGGGDPVLATPRFIRDVNTARPATPLADLATRVARAGVTRVTGRVVGDPTILAGEPLADGWDPRYLTSLDASRSSGLTVDAGVRLFTRSGVLHAEAAKDPAVRTAGELHDLLEARGVKIDRAPARRWRHRAAGSEIARVSSPPLLTLLTHALHASDNHLADGIFRMLGAATGDPTWAGSARAAHRSLADIADGDAWRDVRLADGSGLSRRNRLSADLTVRLLHTMASGPLRSEWLGIQATAGESGTLRHRLTGPPAEGRVHAKTGTLRDVRAMAGTVPGRAGRDHHFAVLANDLEAYRDIAAARRLADVMALALVVEQDGCAGPIPVPERNKARAPETVLCGRKGRS